MCGAPSERFKVLGTRLNRSQGRNPRAARGVGVTVVRCRDCGLVFPDPQPVPQRLIDHYDMPGEKYWADQRAEVVVSAQAVAHWNRLRELVGGASAPAALDVGMGAGLTAKAMIAAGFDVSGIEPIPQFREIARRKLNLDEERIRLCGIEDADYLEASFDVVNFGAVLEHLYDPSGSLAKGIRWLKPGGRIVLEVPSGDWLVAKVVNAFFRLKGTRYVTNTSPMHSPFHLYEFTRRAFDLNGSTGGYVVEMADYDVGGQTVLPSLVQRMLNPLMRRTNGGLTLNVVLRKI